MIRTGQKGRKENSMTKYIVNVLVHPVKTYDTYTCEYSGIEHEHKWQADQEMIEAYDDPDVSQAWYEEVDR